MHSLCGTAAKRKKAHLLSIPITGGKDPSDFLLLRKVVVLVLVVGYFRLYSPKKKKKKFYKDSQFGLC
jgi:hypothetical protein